MINSPAIKKAIDEIASLKRFGRRFKRKFKRAQRIIDIVNRLDKTY